MKHLRPAILVICMILLLSSTVSAAEFTLIAVGDVLPGASWFDYEMPASELLKNVNEKLFHADIVIGNLEEPLTDCKDITPVKDPKLVKAGRDFVLKASRPETAQELKDAGFTVLTLANNHMMDYREAGLLETLDRLGKAGIVTAGAGVNISEAEKPAVVMVGERQVVILSATDVLPKTYDATSTKPGLASMKNADRLITNIQKARINYPEGLIAVSVHWGVEATFDPTPRQRELAMQFIDSGADLVIGSHPHRLQGVEMYKGRPIFYSLGNFQFGTRGAGNESAMAVITYNDDATSPISVNLLPVFIEPNGAPRILKNTEPRYKTILQNIFSMNKDLGTKQKGTEVLMPQLIVTANVPEGLGSRSIAPAKPVSYY